MERRMTMEAKLVYESPELIEYGSLEELTRNNPLAAGNDGDFASTVD